MVLNPFPHVARRIEETERVFIGRRRELLAVADRSVSARVVERAIIEPHRCRTVFTGFGRLEWIVALVEVCVGLRNAVVEVPAESVVVVHLCRAVPRGRLEPLVVRGCARLAAVHRETVARDVGDEFEALVVVEVSFGPVLVRDGYRMPKPGRLAFGVHPGVQREPFA